MLYSFTIDSTSCYCMEFGIYGTMYSLRVAWLVLGFRVYPNDRQLESPSGSLEVYPILNFRTL